MAKRIRESDSDSDPEPQANTGSSAQIVCDMPPCISLPFTNYYDYETHVIQNHNHKCETCKKPFPTRNILDIHIQEQHSAFWSTLLERGEKSFQCFECKSSFASPSSRKLHLIQKHNYPRLFPFNVVKTGLLR